MAGPRLGIFWLVNKRLILDSIPVTEAEPYGVCLNFPTSHIDRWAQLQFAGKVSREAEYEEFPRGRAIYNRQHDEYLLLMDRCILKQPRFVHKIIRELHLPREKTKTGTDAHYQCPKCLRSSDSGGRLSTYR
jgi:hypothetical protein